MKCNIGEIWDFNLEFFDWKTTSIMNIEDKTKEINPFLIITMDTRQNIKKQV